MDEVIGEVVRGLASHAAAREQQVVVALPENLPTVKANADALDQILVNLVDNAIRYGCEGGSIAASLRCDEERLLLHVRDDGPGIPLAERTRVFERFYRVPGNESTGSGLGLAIVQQAAGRMGGSVTLTEGLAGRGVGFLVSLPVPGFRPA